MIAYKKQRRKVDPVKQILARLEEKQSKSGLSLYSRQDGDKQEKDDVLPMVQPFSEATSTASKNSPFFPDLSAARQKAHRRLNAGLQHAIDESDRKSALYAQARADKRLNLTFPPAKSHEMSAPVSHSSHHYSFSGWSDSPSPGVENIRNSHYTSMNPFGYNRRTLAFQPTSLNYVVEWPETWPLKIMSLGKGTGRPCRPCKKKENIKYKPKVFRKVHFEGSPTPCTSPDRPANRATKQMSSLARVTPRENQSKQVSPEMQTTQLSTGTASSQPSVSDEPQQEEEIEELPLKGGDFDDSVSGKMLEVEDRKSTENSRAYSEMSSLSESAYLGTIQDKASEAQDETENQQTGNTTKVSNVPPCTPSPTSSSPKDVPKEGDDESRTLLMEIVSQITAEPGADFMQDI